MSFFPETIRHCCAFPEQPTSNTKSAQTIMEWREKTFSASSGFVTLEMAHVSIHRGLLLFCVSENKWVTDRVNHHLDNHSFPCSKTLFPAWTFVGSGNLPVPDWQLPLCSTVKKEERKKPISCSTVKMSTDKIKIP